MKYWVSRLVLVSVIKFELMLRLTFVFCFRISNPDSLIKPFFFFKMVFSSDAFKIVKLGSIPAA